MQITLEELNVISRLPHYCPVCAYKEWGLEELVHMCWEYLDLLRIYTKPKVCTDRNGFRPMIFLRAPETLLHSYSCIKCWSAAKCRPLLLAVSEQGRFDLSDAALNEGGG